MQVAKCPHGRLDCAASFSSNMWCWLFIVNVDRCGLHIVCIFSGVELWRALTFVHDDFLLVIRLYEGC